MKETSCDNKKDQPNPVRDAAVSKLKAALLAAAMEQLETNQLQQKGKAVQWDTTVRHDKPKVGEERRRSTGDAGTCRHRRYLVLTDNFYF